MARRWRGKEGAEFYRKIGRKGGEKVAEERGSEFYRQIGRKGGESRRSVNRTGRNKGGGSKGFESPARGRK